MNCHLDWNRLVFLRKQGNQMLMYPLPILLYIHFYIVFIHLLLVFTHVMRRPCLCTKLWQNVAEVLHNNRIKFPKDFFRCCPVHEHGHCDITRKRRVGRSWVMYLLCIVQKETNGSCHYSEVCALLRSSGNKNISDTVSYCLVYLFFVFTTFWCHLWFVTEQVHGNMESVCGIYVVV